MALAEYNSWVIRTSMSQENVPRLTLSECPVVGCMPCDYAVNWIGGFMHPCLGFMFPPSLVLHLGPHPII